MALAVCLLLDQRADAAVRRLWDRLEQRGIATLASHTHGRHVPHVSLAVLRRWDLDDVRATVEALPDAGPVPLRFDGLGTFRRGRSWLIPAVSAELVARQERVARALGDGGAELHHHYRPGAWIPHCSLAPRVHLADLGALAATVYDVLPLEAVADRAALIDSGTGEQWPLPHAP
ncbi:2'-5' RNA ligase family protein [Jiangella rhizosphaerae]|uniref:2'-5' RNA ligase family protein n=1 Tax=Jiangella rhizosphaerae TaxID=2293569 RepID=A0A418KWG9_9ACTN|nr:2'-5' RNA ligase family protein [Jiangella rhizosphaerae]RIQ36729.1 2'-5' RNA ligase family protein [Jiangella rhizosphaerae]